MSDLIKRYGYTYESTVLGEPICSCPSGDGSLRWPCKVHPPETATPSVAALIAEIDGLSLHDTYVNFKDIRTILDKYRSAK